jgi:hypothetical protein
MRRRSPTDAQVRTAAEVVDWYLGRYWRTRWDPGVGSMFLDPDRIGPFAVTREDLAAGDGAALFRMLFVTAMFQRRQDVQIMRILRGISREDASEISDSGRLLALVDQGRCKHLRSIATLHGACDLTKDSGTRLGCCTANPRVRCHPKRHTVLLKRYGHFGKVPTSLALVLREAGVAERGALRAEVFRSEASPLGRARALEAVLSRAWRVNQKIASMYLSALTNPDLCRTPAPWRKGVDWTYYVVIDSNVDLFLDSIRYRGGRSYDERREFVRAIARRIDLKTRHIRLHRFNPRLVQQALYLFMSGTNRNASAIDCAHLGRAACAQCPVHLARRCTVRTPATKSRRRMPAVRA